MPFDRSRRERERRLAENAIEIPDVFYNQLLRVSERKPQRGPITEPAGDHLEPH
jgi:hypothetical protein